MATTLRELKQRFVSDYNLPIQVLNDYYFEYFLSLYEPHLGSETKWNEFNKMINDKYSNKYGLFLEDYYKAREHIITSIENSESYKQFNSCNMNDFAITNIDFKNIPKSSIYLETNNRKIFLSVDMKKANFNALKYFNNSIVNNCQTYDDFIIEKIGKHHKLIEYFQKSKYTRQVIFGKLNMPRNIVIQKYIMSILYWDIDNAIKKYNINCFKPYSYNTDELIFEIISDNVDTNYLLEQMYKIKQYVSDDMFKFDLFYLETKKFINSNDGKVVVYIKNEIPSDNSLIIKSCPTTYYAQVYKLLTNQVITVNDLIFNYEHQLSQFLEPLRFAY